MSATTSHRQRTQKTAKEELPRLLAEHNPPISRNKLSRLLDLSLGHVSRACSPAHRERFSGEALGRIAVLLDLPEDYFLETRCAYIARRSEQDAGICDTLYDSLVATEAERMSDEGSLGDDDADPDAALDSDARQPSKAPLRKPHPLLIRRRIVTWP